MFQNWDGCTEGGVATLRCLPVAFHNVIAAFLIFAGAVAMVLIIYAAIKMITSGGDAKQTEAARKIMTSAIIGVVLVLSSFAILYFVGFLTNAPDCVTNPDTIATGGCK